MKRMVSLLFALFLLLGLSSCGNMNGSVMDFQGSATIMRGKKTIPVSKGARLKAKDAVSVDKEGSVWFRLDEYKTVLLGGSSEARAVSIKKNISLPLESGVILARLDRPPGKGESFGIPVGNVTVSAQDAGVFSVQIETPDSAVLCVYQGSVVVYGQSGSALVTVSKGKQIRFNHASGTLIGEAGPIDFESLPKIISDNIQDYAKEAQPAQLNAPPTTASTVEPPPEPEPEAEASVPEEPEPGTPEQGDGQASSAPGASAPTREDAALPDYPDAPAVTFKYMWNGKAFKPYADISWQADRADCIRWQLCDQNGNAVAGSGRFDKSGNGIRLSNCTFDVSPPNGGDLYPMGYAIKLTPYYIPTQGGGSLPMPPVVMELPYFKVSAERSGSGLIPVISTNVGFYFEHSFDSLTDSTEGSRLRIKGKLMPLEGTKTPLEINVLSE